MRKDEKLESLLEELKTARSGVEFAEAGRRLWIDRARETNNINESLRYIRQSTAPSDRWEARQIEKFQEAHKRVQDYLKAKEAEAMSNTEGGE